MYAYVGVVHYLGTIRFSSDRVRNAEYVKSRSMSPPRFLKKYSVLGLRFFSTLRDTTLGVLQIKSLICGFVRPRPAKN